MGQQRQDPTAEALLEAFEVLDTGLGNGDQTLGKYGILGEKKNNSIWDENHLQRIFKMLWSHGKKI